MKTAQKIDHRIMYLTTLSKTELNTLAGRLSGLHVVTGLKGEPVFVVSAAFSFNGNLKPLADRLGFTIRNTSPDYLTAWLPLHLVKRLARNNQIKYISLYDN